MSTLILWCPGLSEDAHLHLPACSAFARRDFSSTTLDENGFGANHNPDPGCSTGSRRESAFNAAVASGRLAPVLMFDRLIAGAVHHRDQPRVRHDDLDHFKPQVLRGGHMMADTPVEE